MLLLQLTTTRGFYYYRTAVLLLLLVGEYVGSTYVGNVHSGIIVYQTTYTLQCHTADCALLNDNVKFCWEVSKSEKQNQTARTMEGASAKEPRDDDSFGLGKENKQTRRPADTSIRQQRMKSWQPILDPVYVIIGVFVLGAVFVGTGK